MDYSHSWTLDFLMGSSNACSLGFVCLSQEICPFLIFLQVILASRFLNWDTEPFVMRAKVLESV